jgi:heme/copper-type cytochrome/quinol oxidase subunit 2
MGGGTVTALVEAEIQYSGTYAVLGELSSTQPPSTAKTPTPTKTNSQEEPTPGISWWIIVIIVVVVLIVLLLVLKFLQSRRYGINR